jgi:hypothetical protein
MDEETSAQPNNSNLATLNNPKTSKKALQVLGVDYSVEKANESTFSLYKFLTAPPDEENSWSGR